MIKNRMFLRLGSSLILAISWLVLDLGQLALIQESSATPLQGGDDGGDIKEGGSRNPCDESGLDLTPIVIDRHNSEIGSSSWGKTNIENPNLWVYIPYEREQISRATLSIRTGNDDEIVYHDRIPLRTLGTTPGLVKISLEEIDVSLEIGQWYRWYLFLNVYCSEEAEQPEQDEISAWIQRQEDVSSDRIYDRLAEIAAIEDPQSRQNAWIEILQELGYNAIADELSTPKN